MSDSFMTPWTVCSPPGFFVHGIFQARTLQSFAILSSRASSWTGIKPMSPASPTLAGRFFTTDLPGDWLLTHCLGQLFCNPMDCSLSGSSVHRISQARILEWVAISFSRGSSQPRDQTHISCIGRWILSTGPSGKASIENEKHKTLCGERPGKRQKKCKAKKGNYLVIV